MIRPGAFNRNDVGSKSSVEFVASYVVLFISQAFKVRSSVPERSTTIELLHQNYLTSSRCLRNNLSSPAMENLKGLLVVLLQVLMISANDQDDGYYNNNNNFYGGSQSQSQYGRGGNSFTSTGGFGGSHSVFQSGGNNVVISRRFGLNDEVEDYISVSNPNIRIDGDYFSCSGLVCPQNTFKCVVTSEAKADDIHNMRTVAECVDKSGNVLEKKEFDEKNPFPDAQPPYSRHSAVDRDGQVTTEDSNGSNTFNSNSVKKLTKEQQEELTRTINQETRRINSEIQAQQQQFQHQMNEFQKNLNAQMKNTFGKGFPFGNNNPFTANFPFGNNNQFASNFPFYNPNNFPFYTPDNVNPYNYGYQTYNNDGQDDQYY